MEKKAARGESAEKRRARLVRVRPALAFQVFLLWEEIAGAGGPPLLAHVPPNCQSIGFETCLRSPTGRVYQAVAMVDLLEIERCRVPEAILGHALARLWARLRRDAGL